MFESLVNGVVAPATALALSFHFVMGNDAEPLTVWVVAGSVVVPLGVFVYEGSAIKRYFTERRMSVDLKDEQDPLIKGGPPPDDVTVNGVPIDRV